MFGLYNSKQRYIRSSIELTTEKRKKKVRQKF